MKARVLSCLVLAGCGGSSTDAPPPRPERFEISVAPFASEGDNVSIRLPAAAGEVRWGVPATVPGVHWRWEHAPPAALRAEGSGGSSRKKLAQGESLPADVTAVSFRAELNASAIRGWPVVMGEMGRDAGTLMLPAYFLVVPQKLDVPLRVCFHDAGVPLRVVASGTMQPGGCVEFGGYLEALDTPVFVARPGLADQELTDGADVPFLVSLDPVVPSPFSDFSADVRAARAQSSEHWRLLQERWGAPAHADSFAVHLLLSSYSREQGLEHHGATVLALGAGTEGFVPRLIELATHEMIHVWNGKHLFARETAEWSGIAFSTSRVRQMAFYEGFTEAFSRILMAEEMPAQRPHLRARWNDSFEAVAGRVVGEPFFGAGDSWRDAYDFGAVTALWLAVRTRAAHGAEEARARFWKVIPDLAARAWPERNPLAAPAWSGWCARDFGAISCKPAGYTSDDLLAVLGASLNPQGWTALRAALAGTVFPTADAVGVVLAEVSAATGVPLEAGVCVQGRCLSTSAADAGDPWPL